LRHDLNSIRAMPGRAGFEDNSGHRAEAPPGRRRSDTNRGYFD
jgi:hypothetical protein